MAGYDVGHRRSSAYWRSGFLLEAGEMKALPREEQLAVLALISVLAGKPPREIEAVGATIMG